MSEVSTYEQSLNSTYKHYFEVTFKNGLDSDTLKNIFLEAAVQSQTTTHIGADISSLQVGEKQCMAVFSHSTALANMQRKFDELLEARMPKHVRDVYDINTASETKRFPRHEVK